MTRFMALLIIALSLVHPQAPAISLRLFQSLISSIAPPLLYFPRPPQVASETLNLLGWVQQSNPEAQAAFERLVSYAAVRHFLKAICPNLDHWHFLWHMLVHYNTYTGAQTLQEPHLLRLCVALQVPIDGDEAVEDQLHTARCLEALEALLGSSLHNITTACNAEVTEVCLCPPPPPLGNRWLPLHTTCHTPHGAAGGIVPPLPRGRASWETNPRLTVFLSGKGAIDLVAAVVCRPAPRRRGLCRHNPPPKLRARPPPLLDPVWPVIPEADACWCPSHGGAAGPGPCMRHPPAPPPPPPRVLRDSGLGMAPTAPPFF